MTIEFDMGELDTFPKVLRKNSRDLADAPAMREKEYGIWQTWTWSDYYQEVTRFAAGLSALGFKPGDKLFIIGQNRPRLYFAVSAAQALGGIPVPTYYDSVVDEMAFVIGHAEARFVIWQMQPAVMAVANTTDQMPILDNHVFTKDSYLRIFGRNLS